MMIGAVGPMEYGDSWHWFGVLFVIVVFSAIYLIGQFLAWLRGDNEDGWY